MQKKFIVRFYIVVIALLFTTISYSQCDSCNYSLPVDIPVELSANFGELRKNHFHTGIDIKTQGVIRKNIRAIDDGFVSRIRISPYGYGRAIYVTHPKTGHVSVYAHLNSFSEKIHQKALAYQYENFQSVIDYYLPDSSLTVKRNEIIALSGNSGGSMGPHLHFEIRDAVTEHTLNPFAFYPQIKDNTKPRIYNLVLYPLNDSSHVRYKTNKSIFSPKQIASGKFVLYGNISSYGQVGIGIRARDFITGSPNKFGIYNIVVKNGNDTIYEHKLDEISFGESKYINSMVDYEHWAYTKKWIQQLWKDDASELNIYSDLKNAGFLNIEHDSTYTFEVDVYDFHANKSSVSFTLHGDRLVFDTATVCDEKIVYTEDFHYKDSCFQISIPKGSLYNSTCFDYMCDTAISKEDHSYIYSIMSKGIPMHIPARISFRIDSIAEKYHRQTYLCELKGNRQIYSGGIVSYNRIVGEINTCGEYVARIDTIPPYVNPIKLYDNVNLKNRNTISFLVKDQESDIESYRAYIDNVWIPLFYDYKKDRIYYTFDNKKFPHSDSLHEFKLIVTDGVENSNEYILKYYR